MVLFLVFHMPELKIGWKGLSQKVLRAVIQIVWRSMFLCGCWDDADPTLHPLRPLMRGNGMARVTILGLVLPTADAYIWNTDDNPIRFRYEPSVEFRSDQPQWYDNTVDDEDDWHDKFDRLSCSTDVNQYSEAVFRAWKSHDLLTNNNVVGLDWSQNTLLYRACTPRMGTAPVQRFWCNLCRAATDCPGRREDHCNSIEHRTHLMQANNIVWQTLGIGPADHLNMLKSCSRAQAHIPENDHRHQGDYIPIFIEVRNHAFQGTGRAVGIARALRRPPIHWTVRVSVQTAR